MRRSTKHGSRLCAGEAFHHIGDTASTPIRTLARVFPGTWPNSMGQILSGAGRWGSAHGVVGPCGDTFQHRTLALVREIAPEAEEHALQPILHDVAVNWLRAITRWSEEKRPFWDV